jgi:hypothetical protein
MYKVRYVRVCLYIFTYECFYVRIYVIIYYICIFVAVAVATVRCDACGCGYMYCKSANRKKLTYL